MKILKSLATVAALALLTMNASAQKKAPMDAQTMTNHIKENVNGITSDQESRILAAEQEYVKSAQAERSSGEDKETMHSKMKQLKETRDSQIKAALNGDQYAQYKKMEESHKGSK